MKSLYLNNTKNDHGVLLATQPSFDLKTFNENGLEIVEMDTQSVKEFLQKEFTIDEELQSYLEDEELYLLIA